MKAMLAEIKQECAEHLLGTSGKAIRLSLLYSEDDLRRMTKCKTFPEGLDFSTDGRTSRQYLYANREDIQEHFQLYFIGVPRVGIRFTVLPHKGLHWRTGEFFDAAHPRASQLVRMYSEGINQTCNEGQQRGLRSIMERFIDVESEVKSLRGRIEAEFDRLPGRGPFDDDDNEDEPPTPAGVRPPPTF